MCELEVKVVVPMGDDVQLEISSACIVTVISGRSGTTVVIGDTNSQDPRLCRTEVQP